MGNGRTRRRTTAGTGSRFIHRFAGWPDGEVDGRPELLDHVAPHGCPDGELVANAVVAQFELEGVEELPLLFLGDRCQVEVDCR